jgi:hypothetical protein
VHDCVEEDIVASAVEEIKLAADSPLVFEARAALDFFPRRFPPRGFGARSSALKKNTSTIASSSEGWAARLSQTFV